MAQAAAAGAFNGGADGLGLFTRDAVLREPPPDHDVRDSSLRLDAGFRQGPVIPISVYEDGVKGIKIYSQDLRTTGNVEHPEMLKLTEEVEHCRVGDTWSC